MYVVSGVLQYITTTIQLHRHTLCFRPVCAQASSALSETNISVFHILTASLTAIFDLPPCHLFAVTVAVAVAGGGGGDVDRPSMFDVFMYPYSGSTVPYDAILHHRSRHVDF